MSKEGYLSITGNPTTLLIFDQFVKQLGITKTAAITDLLEVYMLATDQDLYLKLKRDFLNVDAAKKLLEKRTSNIKIASPDDGRVTYISITKAGKELSQRYDEEYFSALSPFMDVISEEEAECMIQTIEKFYQVMCERRSENDRREK